MQSPTAVAHLLQGFTGCAFRDGVLQPLVGTSGYLSYCCLSIRLNQSVLCPLPYWLDYLIFYTVQHKPYRHLCIKFPLEQQSVKHSDRLYRTNNQQLKSLKSPVWCWLLSWPDLKAPQCQVIGRLAIIVNHSQTLVTIKMASECRYSASETVRTNHSTCKLLFHPFEGT